MMVHIDSYNTGVVAAPSHKNYSVFEKHRFADAKMQFFRKGVVSPPEVARNSILYYTPQLSLPCVKGGGFCEAKDGGIVIVDI